MWSRRSRDILNAIFRGGASRQRGRKLGAFSVLLSLFAASPALAQSANGSSVIVGSFSQGSLSDWRTRSFKGETRYEFVRSIFIFR
jgi:hypothetical protein